VSKFEHALKNGDINGFKNLIYGKVRRKTLYRDIIPDILKCTLKYLTVIEFFDNPGPPNNYPKSRNMFEFTVEYTKFDIDNGSDFRGSTLLMLCLEDTEISIDGILYVLDKIKNINKTDKEGKTAFYKLINRCQDDIEYMPLIVNFMEKDADLYYGHSAFWPLTFAVKCGLFDAFKLIINHSKRDISFDVLRWAIHQNKYDCAEYLVNIVKDINEVDFNGMTLLDIAMILFPAHHEIIELLIESGAVGPVLEQVQERAPHPAN